MSSHSIKKLCFAFTMALLCFPLCFQFFDGTITEKLKGYNPKPKKVSAGIQTWLDGSWQKYVEAYSKDRLQARHFLIRLNNQIKYSLFDELNANAIERGVNDFYFEHRYISTYLGLNFQGEEKIAKNVQVFQELRDSLNAHDIEMLFVIASGKANFMPENMPPAYHGLEKTQNNYETYLKYLKEAAIPHLDFNQYLLEMKDTASYPLYTKGNIHWSFYAMSFVTDTLISTIEHQLDKDLPDYSRQSVEIAYEPTYYTEGGIFKSLNLLWTELRDTFAYRNIIMNESTIEEKYRPKVWAIGDSFYGTLNTYKVPQQFFDSDNIFFYYNNSIVGSSKNLNYVSGSIESYLDELEEQDLIIFFTTDAGLPGCSWGAAQAILKYYKDIPIQ